MVKLADNTYLKLEFMPEVEREDIERQVNSVGGDISKLPSSVQEKIKNASDGAQGAADGAMKSASDGAQSAAGGASDLAKGGVDTASQGVAQAGSGLSSAASTVVGQGGSATSKEDSKDVGAAKKAGEGAANAGSEKTETSK